MSGGALGWVNAVLGPIAGGNFPLKVAGGEGGLLWTDQIALVKATVIRSTNKKRRVGGLCRKSVEVGDASVRARLKNRGSWRMISGAVGERAIWCASLLPVRGKRLLSIGKRNHFGEGKMGEMASK